ncbi:hypothetical protein ZWY2020_024343 [Hordeum vulgare]|nr:hypothetical protein ZWY2020_024343 [Hordeum vulgare]
MTRASAAAPASWPAPRSLAPSRKTTLSSSAGSWSAPGWARTRTSPRPCSTSRPTPPWPTRRRSKYRLLHTVRTHKGTDDKAFGWVLQQEDEAGKRGESLSKDLMAIAGGALKTNITRLGPLVLPFSAQLLFLATLAPN